MATAETENLGSGPAGREAIEAQCVEISAVGKIFLC